MIWWLAFGPLPVESAQDKWTAWLAFIGLAIGTAYAVWRVVAYAVHTKDQIERIPDLQDSTEQLADVLVKLAEVMEVADGLRADHVRTESRFEAGVVAAERLEGSVEALQAAVARYDGRNTEQHAALGVRIDNIIDRG